MQPSKLTFRFILTMMLACCAFVNNVQAQDHAFHPETYEFGVRTVYANIQSSINKTNYQPELSSSHEIGLQAFVLKRYASHNFIRVSLGYAHAGFQFKNNYVDANFGTIEDRDTKMSENQVSYEIAFGKELAQSKEPFLDRFRLRAGFSLNGASVLSSKYSSISTRLDSNQALNSRETLTSSSYGTNILKIGVFGQLGFRVHKGLFMGLEWTTGPSLSVGRRKTVVDYLRETTGQAPNNQQNAMIDNIFAMSWRYTLSAPSFFVGFAF